MLTTIVLLSVIGALILLLITFVRMAIDAAQEGIPVTRLGTWVAASRYGLIDAVDRSDPDEPPASMPVAPQSDRSGQPA